MHPFCTQHEKYVIVLFEGVFHNYAKRKKNSLKTKQSLLKLQFSVTSFFLHLFVYFNGFQPGGRDPHRGREPFLEESQLDIYIRTQLYYICFIRVVDGGLWVMVGCYNVSRYKKAENHCVRLCVAFGSQCGILLELILFRLILALKNRYQAKSVHFLTNFLI